MFLQRKDKSSTDPLIYDVIMGYKGGRRFFPTLNLSSVLGKDISLTGQNHSDLRQQSTINSSPMKDIRRGFEDGITIFVPSWEFENINHDGKCLNYLYSDSRPTSSETFKENFSDSELNCVKLIRDMELSGLVPLVDIERLIPMELRSNSVQKKEYKLRILKCLRALGIIDVLNGLSNEDSENDRDNFQRESTRNQIIKELIYTGYRYRLNAVFRLPCLKAMLLYANIYLKSDLISILREKNAAPNQFSLVERKHKAKNELIPAQSLENLSSEIEIPLPYNQKKKGSASKNSLGRSKHKERASNNT